MNMNSEFFSIYINLLKTVIGVGLLLYPNLIKQHGIVTVMLFSIISALFSASGLILYALVNHQIGRKSTMSSVALYVFPKFRVFADVCVALKCFGVGVIYIIIVKDCTKQIWTYFYPNPGFEDQKHLNLIMLGLFTLVSPLSYIEKMSKLRFTSFIGSSTIIIVLLLNVFVYFRTTNTYSLPPAHIDRSALTSFSAFVYGFTCHQNIFTIQNEMRTTKLKSLIKLIGCVMCTTLIIYWTFGIINFKIYGDQLSGENLFELYTSGKSFASVLVCVLFVIMLLFSFPLQSIPCRIHSESLLRPHFIDKKVWKYGFTTLLLLITFILARIDVGVRECMSLVGGSVSSAICFIICSVYYLKLGNKNVLMNIMASLTLLFGIGVFIGFIYKCLISKGS